jgi:DNA-binding PadR family transcriptional regulator
MSVSHALLGLLEAAPRHGYELKREYDSHFSRERPLKFGQVYATLARLEREGLVHLDAQEQGQGPERKRYAITERGAADLESWLAAPELPRPYLESVLFMKVVLALISGRPARRFLTAQRRAHMAKMQELTKTKAEGTLAETLLADFALFHLEADLKWIAQTEARLDALKREVRR